MAFIFNAISNVLHDAGELNHSIAVNELQPGHQVYELSGISGQKHSIVVEAGETASDVKVVTLVRVSIHRWVVIQTTLNEIYGDVQTIKRFKYEVWRPMPNTSSTVKPISAEDTVAITKEFLGKTLEFDDENQDWKLMFCTMCKTEEGKDELLGKIQDIDEGDGEDWGESLRKEEAISLGLGNGEQNTTTTTTTTTSSSSSTNSIQEVEVEEAEKDTPAEFICPITQDIMEDPVSTADGHTYEREAIQLWLKSNNTSPLTNQVLEHTNLTPNHALRSLIQDYQAKNQ